MTVVVSVTGVVTVVVVVSVLVTVSVVVTLSVSVGVGANDGVGLGGRGSGRRRYCPGWCGQRRDWPNRTHLGGQRQRRADQFAQADLEVQVEQHRDRDRLRTGRAQRDVDGHGDRPLLPHRRGDRVNLDNGSAGCFVVLVDHRVLRHHGRRQYCHQRGSNQQNQPNSFSHLNLSFREQ